MSFTAYYELLRLPEAAQAFTRLGFPAAWFRVELSWAKVAGVAALLVPMVPARGVIYVIKEWAYAGFAINLVSALIAHLSISDRPAALARRRPPACSGGSRTSSGAVCGHVYQKQRIAHEKPLRGTNLSSMSDSPF
jgi:hypothetical protein